MFWELLEFIMKAGCTVDVLLYCTIISYQSITALYVKQLYLAHSKWKKKKQQRQNQIHLESKCMNCKVYWPFMQQNQLTSSKLSCQVVDIASQLAWLSNNRNSSADGRRITWNAHKRKICQIAARDLYAVHSILPSPSHGLNSQPMSTLNDWRVYQQRNKELSIEKMKV